MEHKHEHGQADMAYSCPMHPEVKGNEGDKCLKCGMALEATASLESGNIKMEFSSSPGTIVAGKPARLTLVPTNKDEKSGTVALDIVHDEPIHLIVVSEDLSWFRHIHPKVENSKAYNVDVTFPHGGKYLLFADYTPKGGNNIVDRIPVQIAGEKYPTIRWDKPKLSSDVDGYRVELLNAENIKSNEPATLDIKISKNGKVYKSEDIGTYLGAVAHIMMIGQQDKDFVHIHPDTGAMHPISAHVTVDKPGLYRMWVQFNADEKIITADFAVVVTEGTSGEKGSHDSHAHHH